MFKKWTKTQVAIGVTLGIVLILSVLVYTFVSDYENAKANTLAQATVEINDLKGKQQQLAQNDQSRIDEQLIQSSQDDVLTKDAQFRQDYRELQQTFLSIVTDDEGDAYTKEVQDAVLKEDIKKTALVSLYVTDNDLHSGMVYYLGQPTHAFHFTYTDGVVTEMEHVNELTTHAVQIEDK